MSGGSFNYVSGVRSLSAASARIDELSELAKVLREHAEDSRATLDTYRLLAGIQWIDDLIQASTCNLGKVWHALEWYVSGDYSEDQFRAEVEIYESNN